VPPMRQYTIRVRAGGEEYPWREYPHRTNLDVRAFARRLVDQNFEGAIVEVYDGEGATGTPIATYRKLKQKEG
jgi:hypothetical protein